jgi:hypothetical protein
MHISSPSRNFSKYTLLLIICLGVFSFCKIQRWSSTIIFSSDPFSYYVYLPAVFIQHDPTLRFLEKEKHTAWDQIWYTISEKGVKYTKMPMGLAILQLPFFFLAHAFASAFSYPADGLSLPYQIAICFAALFYAMAGLIILRKILLKYFSDKICSLTLLSIAIGTNFVHYTLIEPGMTHVYSFFLFSGFLLMVLKWFEFPNLKTSILLGLFTGLIILVRPSNIIVFLIPLLYGIRNIRDINERFRFFLNNLKHLIVIFLVIFLISIPQMLYWKLVSGHYIFNGYVGERFFFGHPHIMEGLFSYRKGWLLYTPIMTLALLGFFYLFKKRNPLSFPLLIFTFLNIYIIFSWWCWWYGGSFGARPVIESYSFLALPLAALYADFFNRTWKTFIIVPVIAGCIWLNLFQTYQYPMIHWDSMTKEAYWATFGQRQYPPDYSSLIKLPDYKLANKFGREEPIVFENDAESSESDWGAIPSIKERSNAHSGKMVSVIDTTIPYSLTFDKRLVDITSEKIESVSISYWVYLQSFNAKAYTVLSIISGNKNLYSITIPLENKVKELNTWIQISETFLIPINLNPNDRLLLFVHNNSKEEILIDDIQIGIK